MRTVLESEGAVYKNLPTDLLIKIFLLPCDCRGAPYSYFITTSISPSLSFSLAPLFSHSYFMSSDFQPSSLSEPPSPSNSLSYCLSFSHSLVLCFVISYPKLSLPLSRLSLSLSVPLLPPCVTTPQSFYRRLRASLLSILWGGRG